MMITITIDDHVYDCHDDSDIDDDDDINDNTGKRTSPILILRRTINLTCK